MGVVRRAGVSAAVAGMVLLGGPAWAQQEDPCAPGLDGEVPAMCQSGPATPTVGLEDDQCPDQPVEPGDGRPADEGQQTEPVDPGAPDPQRVEPEQTDPAADGEAAAERAGGPQETVVCALGTPVLDGPGGAESMGGAGSTGEGGSASADQLPRTGPYDRLLALTAVGAGLVLVGAGATSVGRRRAHAAR